jgi:DNA-binding CsgD family transcriptional regulator
LRGIQFVIPILLLLAVHSVTAQYEFDGYVDDSMKDGAVYLSMVEDYRKISGVYHEQIIARTIPDSTGYFVFTGNNLPGQNRMYRIHVDTCPDGEFSASHVSGHCSNSKEVVFVANNTTKLSLPVTFEDEIFCKVISTDERSNAFLKIDSLKNDMRFAFSSYRSEANRKLNTKKWFSILQQYGEQLNEPLAELYVFSFLSDRRSILHAYYLEDLKTNNYYNELLQRLKTSYPETAYTLQYEAELKADQFLVQTASEVKLPWWIYVAGLLALISVMANFYYFGKWKKVKNAIPDASKVLSNQEQKVLELILADKTNKEIATEMYVSVSTVKTHINNLYKKLKVSSRDEVKSLYSDS